MAEPDDKAMLQAAAQYAVYRASRRVMRHALKNQGKPFDVLGEYAMSYAHMLLWRRQIERLGHEKPAAEMSAAIRRLMASLPPMDFVSPQRLSPEIDPRDPDHDPERD